MHVLVTGAGGYVGRAVLRRLIAEGHRVRGLVRTPAVGPPGLELLHGDLFDSTMLAVAVAGVDAVVHLAALSNIREAFSHPGRYYRVNVGGTVGVLEALRERGATPATVVLASTASVYGTPREQPITEDTPPAPANPYAAAKLAAEQAVGWETATGAVGSVVLRLFNVAGADGSDGDRDDNRLITRALAVAAGRLPHLDVSGDGSAVRDFVHVADVASAVALALDHVEPGRQRVCNVGATQVSVADVLASVGRLTGRHLTVVHHPARPDEAAELRSDSSLIRRELGWTPERSELDQIIEDQWHAERTRGHR